MMHKKALAAWMLVIAIIVQCFGLASATSAEIVSPQGLVFNSAKQNSVALNEILEQVPTTFEMRAKFVANPGVRQVLFGNYRASASTQFSIELKADNQLRYYEISNGGKIIDKSTTGLAITTGQWTHLAVIRDVANKKIQIIQDGNAVAAFENVDLPELVVMESLHSIGTDTRNGYHVRAEIAEVRLWSDVRTVDELRDHADANILGNEEGLMHAWKLDSTSLSGIMNVIKDKAGRIDATPRGFERQYASEFQGAGTSFADGLQIATKDHVAKAPRTVEAWVNVPANTPSSQRVGVIMGNYYDSSYSDVSRFSFEIFNNGAPRLYWVNNKNYTLNYVANNVNVNAGDWVHIAMVLDETNKTGTTYINGEKVHEAAIDIPEFPTDTTAREMKIGSDFRGTMMSFKGEIADLRVWSTARTAEEIQAHYNESLQGTEEGLLGNWKLDGAENGIYPDASSYENNALPYDEVTSNWLAPDFAEGDYTIAVIPDTQYMARLHPEEMKNYMSWMKDHADDMNIKLAISVGDIVDTPSSTTEWAAAASAYAELDGVIPYVLLPGNHDVILNNAQLTRNYTNYNAYFPYSKYSQEPTFGGAFAEGKMENTYHYFDIGGVEYMVLAIEFAPNDAVLAWANEVVAANPDKKVIMATHTYVYHNGEHISTDHHHYPSSYISDANNGDDMWNEFVSKHDNIVLVLSGHIGHPDLVVKTDLGDHGNIVQQVLADAQYMDPRDLGMVMLMTFKEGSNDVDVNWYSVKNDQLYRNKNQFTMEMNLYADGEPNPEPEQGEIKLSVTDQSVMKGTEFVVPVTIENGSELVGIEGVLNYDADLLEFEDFAFTALGESGATNTENAGIISFAGISGASLGTNEKTVIANVTFRAKSDLTVDGAATISFSNVQGVTTDDAGHSSYTEVETDSAVITVVSRTTGDLDGDNRVDLLDARAILKLIVSGGGSAAERAAADVNGDGEVNTQDVLALLQMIADKLAVQGNA
ncbi:LamG-like jellyroll fold domain-containing protein [Paenibacillus sp. strain BS8-2]